MKNRLIGALFLLSVSIGVTAQVKLELEYDVEVSGTVSSGRHAPIWLTANRYGMGSISGKSGYLSAGCFLQMGLPKHWQINAGLDLAGGLNTAYNVWLHQAYLDVGWKHLRLSVGTKERGVYPVERDMEVSSGVMVEGVNTQPIPQVRLSLDDYVNVPFTREWFGVKGHIAYGRFMDDRWQRKFSGVSQRLTQDVLYHTKSLAVRLGRRDIFPLEVEIGIIDIAQFAGDSYVKQADGSLKLVQKYPKGFKSLWNAFLPFHQEGNANVEGNHSGSWMAAATWYAHRWKIRAYMEHYFEDHSQIGFEYGMWQDGHLGVEVELPDNRWVSKIVWEGLCTTDQTGAILYDSFNGSFTDIQISGGDNYFTNGQYLGLQHAGMGMTNPLIPGPGYNQDGTNCYKSNRVRAHHIALAGQPDAEWRWRLLSSFVRHWGTYYQPLDKVRKQWSGLVEVTYRPDRWKGWSAQLGIGLDCGNYLGQSIGGMLTVTKRGIVTERRWSR